MGADGLFPATVLHPVFYRVLERKLPFLVQGAFVSSLLCPHTHMDLLSLRAQFPTLIAPPFVDCFLSLIPRFAIGNSPPDRDGRHPWWRDLEQEGEGGERENP